MGRPSLADALEQWVRSGQVAEAGRRTKQALEDLRAMDVRFPAVGSESPVGSNNETPHHAIPTFKTDAERRDWLIQTLGEPSAASWGSTGFPET